MKLYKYRSLANLEYTLDILLNERLHCAPYDKLNDPLEGVFSWVVQANRSGGFASALPDDITFKQIKNISELSTPGDTRVCSLSASSGDVRLWSHYADGHKGIAIEINVEGMEDQLIDVVYVDRLKEFKDSLFSSAPKTAEILRIKTNHWAYEQEYRLISKETFIPIQGKISGVYFGLRTPELLQTLLLRTIPKKTPVYSTKLNEKTIEIESNMQLN